MLCQISEIKWLKTLNRIWGEERVSKTLHCVAGGMGRLIDGTRDEKAKNVQNSTGNLDYDCLTH